MLAFCFLTQRSFQWLLQQMLWCIQHVMCGSHQRLFQETQWTRLPGNRSIKVYILCKFEYKVYIFLCKLFFALAKKLPENNMENVINIFKSAPYIIYYKNNILLLIIMEWSMQSVQVYELFFHLQKHCFNNNKNPLCLLWLSSLLTGKHHGWYSIRETIVHPHLT